MSAFGEEKETNLGHVSSGGDVDEVVFLIDIEGIISGELEERFKDFFEVPWVAWFEVMHADIGLGRHGFEIGDHRVAEGLKLLARKQFNSVDQEIGKLTQSHRRTPFPPTVLVGWCVQRGSEKIENDCSFCGDQKI